MTHDASDALASLRSITSVTCIAIKGSLSTSVSLLPVAGVIVNKELLGYNLSCHGFLAVQLHVDMVFLHLEEEVYTHRVINYISSLTLTSQVLTLQRVQTGFTIGLRSWIQIKTSNRSETYFGYCLSYLLSVSLKFELLLSFAFPCKL